MAALIAISARLDAFLNCEYLFRINEFSNVVFYIVMHLIVGYKFAEDHIR